MRRSHPWDGTACHLWLCKPLAIPTMLLFERTETPTPRIRLNSCGNVFGKDLRYQLLTRDDLCLCYDTKGGSQQSDALRRAGPRFDAGN